MANCAEKAQHLRRCNMHFVTPFLLFHAIKHGKLSYNASQTIIALIVNNATTPN